MAWFTKEKENGKTSETFAITEGVTSASFTVPSRLVYKKLLKFQ